jgi:hypothetical protein
MKVVTSISVAFNPTLLRVRVRVRDEERERYQA